MKKGLAAVILVLVAGVLGYAANGKIAPLSWGLWGDVNAEADVGVRGYDVVSYHTVEKPLQGLAQFSSEHNGAKWHFATLENQRTFEANPERYVPMYGGFCAYAVYKNVTADVNPEIWHIENGRLYLFAGDGPRQAWVADISRNAIGKTDENWAQR